MCTGSPANFRAFLLSCGVFPPIQTICPVPTSLSSGFLHKIHPQFSISAQKSTFIPYCLDDKVHIPYPNIQLLIQKTCMYMDVKYVSMSQVLG